MTTTSTAHDSETSADGQQVITACALIHHDFDGVTKVFLPRRADTKKFLPGVYELPGGHIDFGEDLRSGLAREIDEEFGMEVAIGEPFAAFTYMNDIKRSHSVEIVYFATFTDPIERITLDPADHSDYRWIGADEVEQVYTPTKGSDDIEFVTLRRAFELLDGAKLQTG